MLSEQMITAANRAQAAIASEPRPIELAAVGMDLVRKVRAYAEMAAALEIQVERLSYRLHQAVMAVEEKPASAPENVAKFRRPEGDFLRVFQGGAIRG